MKANHKTYVKSLSVDELLDKEMELDNITRADGGLDEDILMDIYELQFAITEELESRGVFDARDYDEYDAWQGCEEPEDCPPFDDDNDFRADYIDYITERRAIEGPVEWF